MKLKPRRTAKVKMGSGGKGRISTPMNYPLAKRPGSGKKYRY